MDLEALPADVSAAVEAAIAGESITLVRSGHPVGSLEFRSNVLEGSVVESAARHESKESVPDGITVVATAMRLSETARRRLSDELGADYVVLDLHQAPPTGDVLLTHPVSPQLLEILRHQFPDARIVVTEVEDEELGVRYPGPVSRMLDAGAAAYLPPRPFRELAANVHAYLTHGSAPILESGTPDSRVLPPSPARQITP